MFKDAPNWFDAWDIDSMAEMQPVALTEAAKFQVVSEGPLVAALKITRKLHDSEMTQVVRLRRGSRRVDFETEINWQERHKLLKVLFPVNIHADEAIHEIQFGHIRRPTHRSRPFDANRFEVCNHKWTALAEENRGCAVLNESKYGVNVLGNTIGLTLLKSALAPDPVADLGRQTFTYAFYAWNGSFADADLVREGYDLNIPARVAPGAGGNYSALSMDAPNIIVEAIKATEDGSGELVIRMYEAKRMATRCTLAVAMPVYAAAECDMLENKERDLAVQESRIALEFRPFEVKTVRVRVG
jgi:alpha-mannosidase